MRMNHLRFQVFTRPPETQEPGKRQCTGTEPRGRSVAVKLMDSVGVSSEQPGQAAALPTVNGVYCVRREGYVPPEKQAATAAAAECGNHRRRRRRGSRDNRAQRI